MCITLAGVMTGRWSLASAKVPRKSGFAAGAGRLLELHIGDDAIPDPTIRQAKAETVRSTLAAFRRIEVFPRTPSYLPISRARWENGSSSALVVRRIGQAVSLSAAESCSARG